MQLDYLKLRVYCDECHKHIYPQDGLCVQFFPERYYHPDCYLKAKAEEWRKRDTNLFS